MRLGVSSRSQVSMAQRLREQLNAKDEDVTYESASEIWRIKKMPSYIYRPTHITSLAHMRLSSKGVETTSYQPKPNFL